MYCLNVFLTVHDAANIEKVADALQRTGTKSRLEDGCERWEAYQSTENPALFILVERWTTKGHWEQHRQAEAVTQIYLKEVIPLVRREAHPSTPLLS